MEAVAIVTLNALTINIYLNERSIRTRSMHLVKKKAKQPYLTSITRNSNSTDKLEVDGALILLPPPHQCSVLRVFKAT